MGAAIEIVTPDCGMLVAPDVGELALALRQLIEDRDRRLRLSASGPKRAAELCDPAVALPKIENELSSVIERTR